MVCSRFIGIAGPSCAGKTLLAESLATRLGDCAVLAIDRYYRDCSHMPEEERAHQNFDHPDAIEWARLEEDILALRRGADVAMPIYDFERHSRIDATQWCAASSVVIVEGIFALLSPVLREIYAVAVYIDAPRHTCRERRIARDCMERGRSSTSVMDQLASSVEPMFDRYVEPTRSFADLVLDGASPVEPLADEVVKYLRQREELNEPRRGC